MAMDIGSWGAVHNSIFYLASKESIGYNSTKGLLWHFYNMEKK